jgi:hypothetical protein
MHQNVLFLAGVNPTQHTKLPLLSHLGRDWPSDGSLYSPGTSQLSSGHVMKGGPLSYLTIKKP